MSAIWGIIDLNTHIGVDMVQTEQKMRKCYTGCVIDRTEYAIGEDYAVGCGIQYVTAEARDEKLPLVEKEVVFTADAIVDNRDELLTRLQHIPSGTVIPDAALLYEMFQKYGIECLNDLMGIYSFAYYDRDKKELYLVTDATGTRVVHYRYDHGVVYFSTLIQPIAQAAGSAKLNEQWITDFLALDNMAWALENDRTPYEGIYCVPAGHYLRITANGVEKVRYWNPDTVEIKGRSDKAYAELFRQTYAESVHRVMRNQDITIMLSGGLDSTSVAAMVLKQAQSTGQTLTSFTSVPEADFHYEAGRSCIMDEREAVLKTKAYFEDKGYHLKCEFVDLAGRNSWEERTEELAALEMPYKSMQNLLWMKECMKRSYERGARILLSGGYGNVTISNNFQILYQKELVRQLRWIEFLRECYLCGRRYRVGKKQTIKVTYDIFKQSLKRYKLEDIKLSEIVNQSFLRKEWMERMDFPRRAFADYRKYQLADADKNVSKRLMVNDKIFYQSGETQTKHSLATGVIIRDPTMDKRMIELCMKLPLGCFSKNGTDRRLVREYLKEELPKHVIENQALGLQSADTALRLQKNADKVFENIAEIMHGAAAQKYLDTDDIDQYINEMKTLNDPRNNFKILRLEYTALTMEFIDHIK